jgi:hypothetical protein
MSVCIKSPLWLVRLSLTGLVILAHGCSSPPQTDGSGRGGHGGNAGRAGAGGMTGDVGATGGAGPTGEAGTGGVAVTGGATGAGGATGTGGAAGPTNNDAGTNLDAGVFYPLEMNDVTILAPLPQSIAAPVLLRGTDLADDGTSLVPRALFDRLVKQSELAQPILNAPTHERLQLVAVRFDLCDRHLPGKCPEGEDARLRLVFQPIGPTLDAEDVGFHAFYAIRNDEIAEAIASLRALARTVPAQGGPLRVSPALTAANPEAYATNVRAFVRRYGGETRIVRLTVNAQPQILAQVRWALRGVEKKGDAFVDMATVGSTSISEEVIFVSGPSYDVMPITDRPTGLLGAITKSTFDDADTTEKRAYLAALAAVDNPMSHTAETVACIACHVSTVVMHARTTSAALDPLTLPGIYTSKFDLSIAGGKSAETPFTIRALGYLGKKVLISQRVVNDTAQTLTEIETRYPAP